MKTADPLSNVYPLMASDETLPPGDGCDSSRMIELFDDSSDAAAMAADRPLIPAPMMHMSSSFFDELSRVFWIWIDCNGAKAKLLLFELAAAFKTLGFSWLKEKQIAGIIKRAGSEDGLLQLEQFKQEFPKTLRTNLTKLAKKNGGELGFLV